MAPETNQQVALVELVEWWEDLHDRSIGSQAIILRVPPRWGRTHLLDCFESSIVADTSRPGVVVRVSGSEAPDGLALQAQWLEELLDRAGHLDAVRWALGLHRLETFTERALGLASIAGVLQGSLAAAAGLPATVALGAVAWSRDRSTAGQLARVARMSSGLARDSTDRPIAVLVDDAERLNPDLVERLVVTSLDRLGSRILFCVVAPGESEVVRSLADRGRHLSTVERVNHVDVDADMSESARRRHAHLFAPHWPVVAIDRLAAETETFADIWEVLALPRAEDVPLLDGALACSVVDTLVGEVSRDGPPSLAARILAWAGGVMHSQQLDRALASLPATADAALARGRAIARFGSAVRFGRSADHARAEAAAQILADAQRAAAASEIVAVATELCSIRPAPDRIQLVVAIRPVLHLVQRRAVAVDEVTTPLLLRLATELESLGDTTFALRIARDALGLLERSEGVVDRLETELTAMVLRLAHSSNADRRPADEIKQLAHLVEASGAIFELEARVWAAITLLEWDSSRTGGAALVESLAVELADRANALGDSVTSWRLLLAYYVGRAGYGALCEALLAPLLSQETEADTSAKDAWQILDAVGGPHPDLRLGRTVLRSMVTELSPDADPAELVMLCGALADVAARLGEYAEARDSANRELEGLLRIYGPDHPRTLVTRYHAALWTGLAGDAPHAVELFRTTAADMARVLGPDDRGTLVSRHKMALFVAMTGRFADSLALLRVVLRDQERVLGLFDDATLGTRHDVAVMTGEAGDPARALALLKPLIPDMERALGPDNPETLRARNNLAHWMGVTEDVITVVEHYRAVLSDRERVLGPLHPDSLSTRQNLAYSIGLAGDADAAIENLRIVLPDLERVHGTKHPETMRARLNLAWWLKMKENDEALSLARALLQDAREVVGPDHPLTLSTLQLIEEATK